MHKTSKYNNITDIMLEKWEKIVKFLDLHKNLHQEQQIIYL